jgi:hypothetical protein
VLHRWRPVTGFKRAVCGVVAKFEFENRGAPHEEDCNHLIRPRLEHCEVVAGGLAHTCDTGDSPCPNGACIMTEITPDDAFLAGNEFFCERPSDRNTSELVGREVCVYGPFVKEETPSPTGEIHPAELFWWRGDLGERVAPTDALWLMAFQDDSARFDTRDKYVFIGRAQPGPTWRPWAAVPRAAQFFLAFAIDPAGPKRTLHIQRHSAVNVFTKDDPGARADDDDGFEHAIEYDGKIVLQVDEPGEAFDDELGVRFVELCRDGSLL